MLLFSRLLLPGCIIGCKGFDGDAPVSTSSSLQKSLIRNFGENLALTRVTDFSYYRSCCPEQLIRQHFLESVSNNTLSIPGPWQQRNEVRVDIKETQVCAVKDCDSHRHMF